MARIIKKGSDLIKVRQPGLIKQLAEEMKREESKAQPRIEERHFPESDLIKVTVIWDKWDHVADEERIEIIHQAYEKVEGKDFDNRISLATGLTVPEAFVAGMLPYQILPALRKRDPFSADQCRKVMLKAGASELFPPDFAPKLLVATSEEAEAVIKRLSQQLPGSDEIWVTSREIESALAMNGFLND